MSGKEYLEFRGDADLSSISGQSGILLLDPKNITISAGKTTPGHGFPDRKSVV